MERNASISGNQLQAQTSLFLFSLYESLVDVIQVDNKSYSVTLYWILNGNECWNEAQKAVSIFALLVP